MLTGGFVYHVNPENIIISSFSKYTRYIIKHDNIPRGIYFMAILCDNSVDVQVYSRRIYL